MSPSAKTTMPDFCSRRVPYHVSTALMTLLQMGVDLGRVDILAAGEFENYRGEIRSQEPEPGERLDPESKITLTVGHHSAADTLPFQFFYGLQGTREGFGWDERARRLMAPFDAALIRRRSVTAFEALKFSLGFFDRRHIERFLSLFAVEPTGKRLPARELLTWTALLPTYHHWAGNPEYVEQVLHMIFGYQFRIEENISGRYETPPGLRYSLGSPDGHLGRETLLGGGFSECDSRYRVTIRDVDAEGVRGLLPGRPIRKKMENILAEIMPGGLEYEISVRPQRRKFQPGAKQRRAYLGYSTYVRSSR